MIDRRLGYPIIRLIFMGGYRESSGEDGRHVEECQSSLDFVSFIPATDEIDTAREESGLN